MQPEEPGALQSPGALVVASTWQTTMLIGVVTLILGVIVSFHPTGSLNVIAVLLGILMILSGIFHLVRMFNAAEPHRVWLGIAGLLYVVIGVVLIRHLHLTLAIIGLFVGISWIVQGVVALVAGLSGGSREGRGWWIFFGIVSLIAGIVVTATPVSSVTVLAVLVGIWFIVMGLFEIIGALMLRHAVGRRRADMVDARGSTRAGA
ncbi:MAG: HdeD family acid-resistance protein [Micromonosporaceae bacterium]